MSAWTKGPWYWDGDELRAEHGRWHDNALLLVCAEMPCDENARLIASAPCLAAALDDLGYTSSELLYAADHDTGGAAVESWLGALRESMERARAALAKAKGE